jgi:hypothetical protein
MPSEGERDQRRKLLLVGSVVTAIAVVIAVVVVVGTGGGSKVKPVAPKSVIQAVSATTKAKARRFTISGTLTPAMAAYFGGSTLTGSGVADFTTDTAQWTVTVPKQIGGSIEVVARGNDTWVDVGDRGQFVELATAADYQEYDRVPLVRDLVEVTNPFRDLNLASSTAAPVEQKSIAFGGSNTSQPTARLASFTSGAIADNSLPADTSLDLEGDCKGNDTTLSLENEEVGTPDPKVLTTDYDVTDKTAEDDVLSSWNSTTITTQDVDSGVCSVKVSLEKGEDGGFDIVMSIDNPIPPVHLSTPGGGGLLKTFSLTTTEHLATACDVGTWSGTSDTEFAGFDSTIGGGSDTATVSQSPVVGGGRLTIKLGHGSAVVTSSETFKSTETVSSEITFDNGAAPAETSSSHPVTYTRQVAASGTSEAEPDDDQSSGGKAADEHSAEPEAGDDESSAAASESDDDAEVALVLAVAGPVSLTESGSFVGAQSTERNGDFEIPATINCDDHQLTLGNELPFGLVTLKRTVAGLPQLGSTTTVSDWRVQVLQGAASPSPTPLTPPAPVTSSGVITPIPSNPASPAPPLSANVLGATQAQWDSEHQVDPNIPGNYDPASSDAYPGAYVQDRFQTVTFADGRVQQYQQFFTPNTTQAQADEQVKANLPADAIMAEPAENLGECEGEEWTSRSLVAADSSQTSGLIFVTFTDSYMTFDFGYSPSDVRVAFVNVASGRPFPLTPADKGLCG